MFHPHEEKRMRPKSRAAITMAALLLAASAALAADTTQPAATPRATV